MIDRGPPLALASVPLPPTAVLTAGFVELACPVASYCIDLLQRGTDGCRSGTRHNVRCHCAGVGAAHRAEDHRSEDHNSLRLSTRFSREYARAAELAVGVHWGPTEGRLRTDLDVGHFSSIPGRTIVASGRTIGPDDGPRHDVFDWLADALIKAHPTEHFRR
jgi:hypothetical protein